MNKTKGGLVLASQKHIASLVEIVVINPNKREPYRNFFFIMFCFLFFLVFFDRILLLAGDGAPKTF